jgi:glycosyltransferase involved in cell wall biosynthesis
VDEISAQPDAPDAVEGPTLLLSVIIPARNEEQSLPACVESLVAQSEPGFALGSEWELILVDDHSTDRTHALASQFAAASPGVIVLQAPDLPSGPNPGFTGKTNACWTAAQQAHGRLLLFTDADTVHEPGSLSRARHELEKYKVALLSYSPRQVVSGFAQIILMPLVFAELANTYDMKKINDPAQRLAAANGQFLMVTEEAYFAVGGHRGVGPYVLEDVALAHNIKRGKRPIRFRYAADALSTRMYRTAAEMFEGWTKNLALLFNNSLALAAMRLLELLLILCIPAIAILYPFPFRYQVGLLFVVWVRVLWRFYARTAKSNFPAVDVVVSILGLPILILLLVRSYIAVKVRKSVEWKGRSYSTTPR